MRINKGTFIYQVAMIIYLAATIFEASMFGYMVIVEMVLKAMRYIAYLLLVWKIIVDNCYDSSRLLKYGVGILISLLSYLITKDKTIIFLMLFLIAVSNVYFHDAMQVSLWTNGICLFSIILFFKCGLIPDRFASNERDRHSLGFNFPTTGSNYWLYFILIYIVCRKEKLRISEVIILESITYYFFARTDTKSAFAVSTIALFMAYALKFWKGKRGKWLFSFGIRYITIIGTICFSLLIFLWDKVQFVSGTVDVLLTNRIGLSYEAVHTYGVRLFGQPIQWVGGTNEYDIRPEVYNYVDSSYMRILLSYGVVVLLIICVLYIWLGTEIIKVHDWYMGMAIVLGALHSTFDPQLLMMQYNIFLLAFGYLMISDKIERRKYLFGFPEEGNNE